MQMGLLWFNNNPAVPVKVKAEEAAQRYREKFGQEPNTCYVNRAAMEGAETVIALPGGRGNTLRMVPANNILPHHFWVGVEEAR